MPGQDLNNALIRTVTAQSAVSQYQAVVGGNAEDTCTCPAASNATNFLGFALQSASSGQTVQVHMFGGIAKAIAGASVSRDTLLIISGTGGKLANLTATNSNRYVVAKCLRDGVDGDVVPVLIFPFIQQGA